MKQFEMLEKLERGEVPILNLSSDKLKLNEG